MDSSGLRNRLKSRRGSYLVEAVLIMPIIVVITVMMMCASMYMYVQTEIAEKMDHQVRSQAGENSKTVFYVSHDNGKYGNNDDSNDSLNERIKTEEVYISGNGGITAEKESVFDVGGMWPLRHLNTYSCRSSEVNECSTIWKYCGIM